LLAATLALLSGGFQFAIAFYVDLLLMPRQVILRRASSRDSGVPGRMHSLFSDLCQRSILPLDCG